jgi:hypothetical protein
MSTTLNGVPLVEPSRCTVRREPTGSEVTRAGGKVAWRGVCSTSTRQIWQLEWDNLDPDERTTIETEWLAALDGEVVFIPPDAEEGEFYMVRAGPDGYEDRLRVRADGTFMHTLRLTLKEAL